MIMIREMMAGERSTKWAMMAGMVIEGESRRHAESAKRIGLLGL